jgi:hypothetical protein
MFLEILMHRYILIYTSDCYKAACFGREENWGGGIRFQQGGEVEYCWMQCCVYDMLAVWLTGMQDAGEIARISLRKGAGNRHA